MAGCGITDEDDAGSVAIADGPADKVWVGLASEGAFNHVFY